MRTFISYCHEDSAMFQRLMVHLNFLEREKLISNWHDYEIHSGMNIDDEIKSNLEQAELTLLLVSPNFIASDYCMNVELKHAIYRHKLGHAIVVPIIIEHCDWTAIPELSSLKALPVDAMPISAWDNMDEAFLNVIEEIITIISNYKTPPSPKTRNLPHFFLENNGTPQKFEMPVSQTYITVPTKENLEEHVKYLLSGLDKAIKQ